MFAILKLIWFFVAMRLVAYISEVTSQTLNPEKVTDQIINLLPFLQTFEAQLMKRVSQFLEQMEFALFFTILLLGVDLLCGQFKGFKAPFKIVLNAIIYLIGFSLIIFIFGFKI